MQSHKYNVTDEWQTALSSQIGSLIPQAPKGIMVYVGDDPDEENALLLPIQGWNFTTAVTVHYKRMVDGQETTLGVIK